MKRIHRLIFDLKHWQVFLTVVCAIGLVGYPLHMLGRNALGWAMPFEDSPAIGIVLYACMALWFDTVVSQVVRKNSLRPLSALFMVMFAGAALWLRKDHSSPEFVYILPLFVLAILWLIGIVIPAARAINAIRQPKTSRLPIWADVLLVAAWFPFGLWFHQPRLNTVVFPTR